MTPIHFGRKRSFWLLRGLGGVAMAALSAMMARAGQGTFTGWVGIAGVIFFGAAAVVGFVQGTRREPRLTIDDTGVHDRTLGVGVIPWSDIAGAEPYGVAKQPFVGLHLRNEAKYIARASFWSRMLARIHASSGLPAFSVNLSGLEGDPSYIAELIMSRCTPDEPRMLG